MSLSKREKWLFKLLFLLLTVFILVRWVLFPAWDYYSSLQIKIRESEHSWEINHLLLADGEKYLTMLKEAGGQLAAVEKGFYHQATNQVRLEVIRKIDSLLQKSELQLNNKDLQTITTLEKDGQQLDLIRYRGELKGQLPDLVNFLQSLNRLEKLYQVKELEIRGGTTESSLTIYILIEVINTGVDQLEK